MVDYYEPIQARWTGEEIDVLFSARRVKTDCGVPGSTIYEIEDIEIDELKILGVVVDPKDLPQKLRRKIEALEKNVEWE